MFGLTYRISNYLDYISQNQIYFEDKNGNLFSISFELSKLDQIFDKNNISPKKRLIEIISPAIELWLQNMY